MIFSFVLNKLKFQVSLKSIWFELSYDGICLFQYDVPLWLRGWEGLSGLAQANQGEGGNFWPPLSEILPPCLLIDFLCLTVVPSGVQKKIEPNRFF